MYIMLGCADPLRVEPLLFKRRKFPECQCSYQKRHIHKTITCDAFPKVSSPMTCEASREA
jgi:hypothetical protein